MAKRLWLLAVAALPLFLSGCIAEERHGSRGRYSDRPTYYGNHDRRYREDRVYTSGPRYYGTQREVVYRQPESYRTRRPAVVVY